MVLPTGIAPASSAFARQRSSVELREQWTDIGALGGSCTRTGSLLRRVPLLLGYKGEDEKWSPWQDSHPHWSVFETDASADWATQGLVPTAGFAPAIFRLSSGCLC